MLDSTEYTKMESGLKVFGGKSILNSTNFEDGDDRFFKVLSLCKDYGASVVIGTIDEEGMARSFDRIVNGIVLEIERENWKHHPMMVPPLKDWSHDHGI